MNNERIAKMADRIAAGDDEALAMVDQAIDTIVASIGILDKNLPKVQADGVPQQAAIDAVKDLVETALKPYTADVIQAMTNAFGE